MLDALTGIDQSLFMFLNGELTNFLFDWFMPFVTNARTWMPVILIAWLYMVCNSKTRVLALALLVSVGFTDLFCARILKKSIGRVRPCSLEQTENFKCRLLLPKKGSESFPSNHAANTAAFATTVLLFCGLKTGLLFVMLSFLVGYSRIYCGVHFPLDVLAGWMIGALTAFFVWYLGRKYCLYRSKIHSDSGKLLQQRYAGTGDHSDT